LHEANASRYHGKATRAVAEYLAALDEAAEPDPNHKQPKVISPSDRSSAWTAKANKRVQFGHGLSIIPTPPPTSSAGGREPVHLATMVRGM
jgi:hypothetical protein